MKLHVKGVIGPWLVWMMHVVVCVSAEEGKIVGIPSCAFLNGSVEICATALEYCHPPDWVQTPDWTNRPRHPLRVETGGTSRCHYAQDESEASSLGILCERVRARICMLLWVDSNAIVMSTGASTSGERRDIARMLERCTLSTDDIGRDVANLVSSVAGSNAEWYVRSAKLKCDDEKAEAVRLYRRGLPTSFAFEDIPGRLLTERERLAFSLLDAHFRRTLFACYMALSAATPRPPHPESHPVEPVRVRPGE